MNIDEYKARQAKCRGKAKGLPLKEQDITGGIIKTLVARGVLCWRNQSGKVKLLKSWMHLAPKGSPDIVGIMPHNGKFFGIETKIPGGKQSAHQSYFEKNIRRCGAHYALVESVASGVEYYEAWREFK